MVHTRASSRTLGQNRMRRTTSLRQNSRKIFLNAVRTNPHDPGTTQRWKSISQQLDRVRAKVLSEAHIVVATCDLLLREKINQHLTPTLLLKDEDGASIRQKLIALLGSFPTLRFVSLFGDTKQKGPFTLTYQLTPTITRLPRALRSRTRSL
jgi:hypothetical protein